MSRINVVWRAFGLTRRERRAEARAAAALARAGNAVYASSAARPLDSSAAPAAGALVRRLADIQAHEARTAEMLAASLASDRRDFARVAERARWLVIVRGVLDRWIARHELGLERRARRALERELGALALDGGAGAAGPDPGERLGDRVPDSVRAELAAARAEAVSARAARTELLQPYGGRALPVWMGASLRELARFARSLLDQAKKRLLLKPPALAGLLAGWWVARIFAPSLLEQVNQSLGGFLFEEEHARRERLAFWLPLLAAGLCAYLGSLVDTWVLRRYALGAAAGDTRGAGAAR